ASRFLGKGKATDVLSFPSEPASGTRCTGEIAISAEIASQNARLLGHKVTQEIKVLTLHGILHLAGYDHQRDQGEMARQELRLRTKLNLPTGLIERSQAGGAVSKPGRGSKSGGRPARQTR